MKKIIVAFLCSLIVLPAMAESTIINYIYGKAMVGDVEGLRTLSSSGYSLETKDDDGNIIAFDDEAEMLIYYKSYISI